MRVRRSAVALLLVSFPQLTGCDVGPEALIRVEADDDVGQVDQLNVSIHTDDEATALVQRNTGDLPDALPQTFLVRPGSTSLGELVRVHVEGVRDGTTIAAGDAVITLPETGRSEEILFLHRACAAVSCPRLQSCDAGAQACDAACGSDAACAEILGCAASSACTGADLETGLGTCSGEGADLDGDGFRDGRCQLDPDRGDPTLVDCDDSSATAMPGAPRRCGAARDHDCNGTVDERELCASACAASDVDGIEASDSFQIDIGADVRALAGMRTVDTTTALVFVGSPGAVRSYRVDLTSRLGRLVSSVDTADVRQLFLIGSLLAAATSEGLLLITVDDDGSLRSVSGPMPIPPDDPRPLTSVLVADGTAWVSGIGVGLAAVDVRDPETPHLLGLAEGPPSSSLSRAEGIVLAATADARTLVLYPAPIQAPPGALTDLTTALGLMDVQATAVTTAPGRAGEGPIIAVATLGADGGIRTYERTGSEAFAPRDERTGLAIVSGLHFDAGVLLYATSSGATTAIVRAPEAGMLSMLSHTESRGAEGELAGFWATTGDDDQPIALVGLGRVVRVVLFGCTTPP